MRALSNSKISWVLASQSLRNPHSKAKQHFFLKKKIVNNPKEIWHGRSTLFPWRPLLQTWPVHTCLYLGACRLVTGTSSWVPWNGRGRRLVELTEGCYSGGDSHWEVAALWIKVTPVSLGYPLSVFNKNSTMQETHPAKSGTHWQFLALQSSSAWQGACRPHNIAEPLGCVWVAGSSLCLFLAHRASSKATRIFLTK